MHPWQINSAPFGRTPTRRRELLSGYFTAVTAMDHNLGRLLDWLEAHSLSENTLIIFTSDNGMNMGHHGIYGKGNGTFPQNMYDTSVKVPAIMSHPSQIKAQLVSDVLLSHYDLMPTLLEYLGLEAPTRDNLPGKSFAGLLRGQVEGEDGDKASQEAVVIYDEYGPVRMIRNHEWKYIHRYPYGPHELYHLAVDPSEQQNLIGEAACQDKIIELKAGLEDWFARFVKPQMDGRHEAVTGMGQLGLAGLAAKGHNNFASNWFYLKDKE
jgi:choline-sulfatase